MAQQTMHTLIDAPGPMSIEALEKFYTISEVKQISQFLEENAHLMSLLLEAPGHIGAILDLMFRFACNSASILNTLKTENSLSGCV